MYVTHFSLAEPVPKTSWARLLSSTSPHGGGDEIGSQVPPMVFIADAPFYPDATMFPEFFGSSEGMFSVTCPNASGVLSVWGPASLSL